MRKEMNRWFAILLTAALAVSVPTLGGCSSGSGAPAPASSQGAGADSGNAAGGAAGNAAQGADAQPVSEETVVWDWALPNALTHSIALVHQKLADEVYEKSGGRLKINLHAYGELPVDVSEYLVACGEGTIQMASCDATAIGGSLNCGTIPAMPLLCGSLDEMITACEEIHDEINADLGRYGVKFLAYAGYPMQQLWGVGECPQSVADLKGMIVRSQGTEMSVALEKLGTSPVTISGNEVTTALSRGTINATVTAGITITTAGWGDFVDWGYLLNLTTIPCYVVVNQQAFDALPADIQQILTEVGIGYSKNVYRDEMVAAEEEAFRVCREEYGFEFGELDDASRKKIETEMVDYWYEYAENKKCTEELKKVLDVLGKNK